MEFFKGLCIKTHFHGLTALEWERLVLEELARPTGETIVTVNSIVRAGYELTETGHNLAILFPGREYAWNKGTVSS